MDELENDKKKKLLVKKRRYMINMKENEKRIKRIIK